MSTYLGWLLLMMSGDNFSDGSSKTRPVLGDLTNLPPKRGFLSISENSGGGSGDSEEFAKRVCLQVENLVKEKCQNVKNSILNDKELSVSLPKKRENIVSVAPNAVEKIKSSSRVSDLGVEVGSASRDGCLSSVSVPKKGCDGERRFPLSVSLPNNCENSVSVVSNAVEKIKSSTRVSDLGVEGGGTSREGCVSSVSVPKKGCDGEGRLDSDATLLNDVHEELLVSCVSGDKDRGVGSVVSSKCGSTEWLRLPKSQALRSFELERCVGVKGDRCVNLNAGADLLKDCSCSFCLKAGYIWSDLHYQDIKGRIAALKKSQKEANFLVENCGKGKQTDVSELESGLMSQWKSLFLHMEDIFVNESSQLVASWAARLHDGVYSNGLKDGVYSNGLKDNSTMPINEVHSF